MKKLTLSISAALLVGCGGNSTSSGGGGGGIGPTPHSGLWELIANVAITIGDTNNSFTHTSKVLVGAGGSGTVQTTDSSCALSARASGNLLTYEETCSFTSGCIVTFTATAVFSKESLSGSFGTKRFVCSGSATSYSGNLIGSKVAAETGLQLAKSGVFNDEDGDGKADEGETITYSFAVTNGSSVTLTNVRVTDPNVPFISCPGGNPMASLGRGARATCTGTYHISQTDIAAGKKDNTATADSNESSPVDATATVNLP